MKTRLFLVLIFVGPFCFAVYLMTSSRVRESIDDLSTQNIHAPAEKDTPSGEIILNKPGRDSGLPYEVYVLSNLFLKNQKTYFGDDGKTPMVDLELGFVKDGEEKWIAIQFKRPAIHRIRADRSHRKQKPAEQSRRLKAKDQSAQKLRITNYQLLFYPSLGARISSNL